MKNHIVILGGGFGGLAAFLYLKKIKDKNLSVTLIDRNDYHFYYPNIYEIASAYLNDDKKNTYDKIIETINIPFKNIFKNDAQFKLLKAEIEGISFAKKEVNIKNNIIKYDYLILALGSETNYFDIPGAKTYSLDFKNVYNALNIRNKIEETLCRYPNKGIKIVIAGGGFSGCELSTELSFFLKKIDQKLNRKNKDSKIIIIEASPSILPKAKEITKIKTLKRLNSLGIEVILNAPIKEVKENFIITGNDQPKNIYFDILIWTTGITTPSLIHKTSGINLKSGCLIVNNNLQLEPFKEIMAIGDNSYCQDEKGNKIPATAYYAVDQGKIAAYNIISLINKNPLKIYQPRKPIFIIPLGSKYAIADFNFLIISGFIAWLIKQLVNLKYFLSILSPFQAVKLWLFSSWIFAKND